MDSFSYGASGGEDYGNVWKQENYNMYTAKTDGGYPLLKEEHVQHVPDHYTDLGELPQREKKISFMGFNQNELFMLFIFVLTVTIFAINMNNRICDLERRLEMLMILNTRGMAPMSAAPAP